MVRQATGYDEQQDSSLERLLLHLFVTAASRVLPERAFREIAELRGQGFETYCFDFVSEWMHGVRRREFRPVAEHAARSLNLVHRLQELSIQELGSFDLFPCIDTIILQKLLQDAIDNLLDPDALTKVVERRRTTFWYEEYEDLYDAIVEAGHMTDFLRSHAAGFHLTSAQEIWAAYTSDYYRMDACYRKFHTAFAKLLNESLPTALDDRFKQLAQTVESSYAEGYLERLGENWTKNCAHDLAPTARYRRCPSRRRSIATRLRRSRAASSSSSRMPCATRSPRRSRRSSSATSRARSSSRAASPCSRASRSSAWQHCCRTRS